MMDFLFIDLDNNWAQACIVELAQQSLVSGYGDDRFRPEANLTRAELAALMVKAFADADSVRSPVVFADVPNTHWAYDAIQTATANGFFSGYPDGRFQPDRLIPRVQAISVLAATQASLPEASIAILDRYFEDDQTIPDWAKGGIARATAGAMVVNYPNPRQLEGDRPIRRDEVAAMLCRTQYINAIAPEYIAGFPPPPTQARPVLNQPPKTLQSYFGVPLSVNPKGDRTTYTYVSSQIWQQFPDFESGGEFAVSFIGDRAANITFSPTSDPTDPFDGASAVETLFESVFGYLPAKRESYPGWNIGGHEGFATYKECLGDGIATTYDYIGTLGGAFHVSFEYDRTCE